MILGIYVIKDTVVGAFQNPFYLHNDAETLRIVKTAVNAKEKNALQENTEDKQLYKLGTYDDATGEITSNVQFMANLIDLKIKEKGE